MSINKKLLDILCCPQTKIPVEVMGADALAALNQKVAAGEVQYCDETKVDEPLAAALITKDHATIYRIDDDIPVMIQQKGIAADQLDSKLL